MVNYIRLINKEHPLSEDYVPENLVDTGIPFDALPGDSKRLMEIKAAEAAHYLFVAAHKEGLHLFGISSYRSYSRQKELYNGSPYIAAPGTSEHQSGLALDVSSPSNNLELTASFAQTPEGMWLAKNASLYGYLLRYPENKEAVTGVPAEPWHIRYVGKELACCLALTGLTLEEYHRIIDPHSPDLRLPKACDRKVQNRPVPPIFSDSKI